MTDLPAWVSAALRCPVTGAELRYSDEEGGCFRTVGVSPTRSYPVREGIPLLLAERAIIGD